MFNKLITYLLRKKAIFSLKRKYRYMNEVEKLMEMYATRQILSGIDPASVGQSRQLLLKHQQTVKVQEDFIEFLNSL
jgi:hypothetical protein